jgi:hypothetical protein
MNTIATRLQAGTAAFAVAAAATLVPVAAHAAPEISVPTAPVTQVLDRVASGVGVANVPEFSFFYFGVPSPAVPAKPRLTLFSLKVPILTPILGLLGLLNKQLCLGGLSVKINGYGRITASIGLGC